MFVKILFSLVSRFSSGAPRPGRPRRTAQAVVTVQPYQTLWTIAEANYGGDVRGSIWRIEQANHLAGATIQPGEKLVLP